MSEQTSLPYVKGSDTSEAAAKSMEPHVSRLQAHILRRFAFFGPATCDQIEEATGLKHQTVSARIRELVLAGKIEPLEDMRWKTRSGRSARVYRLRSAA